MTRRGAFSKLVFLFRVSSRFFWPAFCVFGSLDVWIRYRYQGGRVFVYLSVVCYCAAKIGGGWIPAEAPLQQQVAIRHITLLTHSQLTAAGSSSGSLLALFAVSAAVFSLLFAFECGPMSMEWSGVEWRSEGVGAAEEALAHGCRGSQAALSSPISQCSPLCLSRPSSISPFDLSKRQRQLQPLALALALLPLLRRIRSIQVSSILRYS